MWPDGAHIPGAAPSTLMAALRHRASTRGTAVAYTFLARDGEVRRRCTYAEVSSRVRALARGLKRNLGSGQRVLITLPPGFEFLTAFLACLEAGVIAVPLPEASRRRRRLEGVAADCAAAALWSRSPEDAPGGLEGLTTENLLLAARQEGESPEEAELQQETVAFLQYTSGSTGKPKGAVITHRALVENLEMIRRVFQLSSEDIIGSWLPPFHDMGLVGGLLTPLWAGVETVLMPPLAFLSKPLRWLEMIERFRITVSGGPDFAYRLCVRRTSAAQRDGLDLSSWQLAFSGAEPVRWSTVEAFAEAFAPAGFRRRAFVPCYGLAEATLLVSAGERGAGPRRSGGEARDLAAVSCGRAAPGVEIRIRPLQGGEASGKVGAEHETGEIWVASPALAEGYWNPPPLGEDPFIVSPSKGKPAQAGPAPRRWLRTGDLGFLEGGELFITGRLKDLLILRGRNLHPEDLEEVVRGAHSALFEASVAAFAVPAGEDAVEGEEAVVTLAPARAQRREVQDHWPEILAAVRRDLSEELGVEVRRIVPVRPGSLAATSSGKVRRHKVREAFEGGDLPLLLDEPGPLLRGSLPGQDASSWLEAFLAERTGESLEVGGAQRSLADFGLDSMGLTGLQHRLEEELGVRVPLETLLQGPSLASLAALLEKAQGQQASRRDASGEPSGEAADGPREEHAGELLPSEGQTALYFLHQSRPGSNAYHLSSGLRIQPSTSEADLLGALRRVVERHEALRTGFVLCPKTLRPKLQPLPLTQATALRVEDARRWNEAELQQRLAEETRRPFDLASGPLLRAHLWRRSGEDLLLLSLHHIAGDLWSVVLLWEELSSALAKSSFPKPRSFYSWVRQMQARDGAVREGEDLEYWRRRLAHLPPPAEIPTDRHRQSPGTGGAPGRVLEASLGEDLTASMEALARRRRATPYMIQMAAFQILLARMTGLCRLTLGTLSSQRTEASTARTIGYFINPLVVVGEVPPGASFENFLSQVKERTIEDLAHGGLAFRRLVTELAPPRESGRHPFFSTLFSWQGTAALGAEPAGSSSKRTSGAVVLARDGAETSFAGETARILPLPAQDAAFDLSFFAASDGGRLLWKMEAREDLYDATTLQRTAGFLKALMEQALADPSAALEAHSLLSPAQRQQFLWEDNDTGRAWEGDSLVGEIIRQARSRPEAVAVTAGARQLTFGELVAAGLRLAVILESRGVGPESLVALAMSRSPHWVVGALGTLFAGGAFLPLDPTEPAQRRTLILDAGEPDLILVSGERPAGVDSELTLDLEALDLEALDVETPNLQESVSARELPGPRPEVPGQLAYVLFTSGSTGRPKGAMNTRGGFLNRLRWMQRSYGLEPEDVVLQKTPLTFDVSMWEVFWPLMTGARLTLAPDGAHRDPRLLARQVLAEGVTVIHFVPSLLPVFVEEMARRMEERGERLPLRLLIASGEALEGALARRVRQGLGPRLRFENLYGPTEAAIDVTAHPVPGSPAFGPVPIGRPIDNTSIFLLDPQLQPVPPGAPGEIFLGGVQLARGYRRDSRRTAESFLPSPWGDGERLYRTGDLGVRRREGSVVFLRRIDGQVKIRGIRVEVGEIETVLASHPKVREAAVFLEDRAGLDSDEGASAAGALRHFSGGSSTGRPGAGRRTRLVACVVPWVLGDFDPQELQRFLRQRLPPAMEPQIFRCFESLPRTSSGKLDRSRLESEGLEGEVSGAGFMAPGTRREKILARTLEQILGVPRVGIEDDFFSLGGDSIQSLRVRSALEQEGWSLGLEAFLERRTVGRLAEAMSPAAAARAAEPAEVEASFPGLSEEDRELLPPGLEDAYPLARTQSGVIFHSQFDAAPTMYRDLFLVRLEGPLVPSLLEAALQAAVDRHPMLRTIFDLERYSEALQLVQREAVVHLTPVDLRDSVTSQDDLRGAVESWIQREISTPLDWSVAPVSRFFVLIPPEEGFFFITSFFDALLDGWSAASLAEEVLGDYDSLLAGEPAKERAVPAAGYRRFVEAERRVLASASERQLWNRRLERMPAGEILPREGAVAEEPGEPEEEALSVITVELPEEVLGALEAVASREGTGLKEVLLTVHLVALSAFFGRRSLTTGLEVNCRPEIAGADRVLGMHMNILPFPMVLGGGTWRMLLRRVADQESRWLRHHRFPFAEMAREAPGSLAVDTVFNYTHFHVLKSMDSLKRLQIREAFGFNQTSFPLRADFNRHPISGSLHLSVTVRRQVLGKTRQRRLAETYRRGFELWARRPEGSYQELSALAPAQARQILRGWAKARASESFRDRSPGLVPEAFFEQVSRNPGGLALESPDGISRTYEELGRRVRELMAVLAREGCGPGAVVGILSHRSIDSVAAMLAVLGVGGAFFPLGVEEPTRRLEQRIRQARAHRILVEPGRPLPSSLESLALPLDPSPGAGDGAPEAKLSEFPRGPEAVAYLMFTSGSTGQPKAVAVSHGALAHILFALAERLAVVPRERWLALTEGTFDISLVELFLPLITGGTCVLAAPDASREPLELVRWMEEQNLDAVQATPAVWQGLLASGWKARGKLRRLSGGEALPAPLAAELLSSGGGLWNLYGPTEATIWATVRRLKPGEPVDLGEPLGGVQVYVLDESLRPLGEGIEGEIYLGGAGIAMGYWDAPRATAASFLPDPFGGGAGRRIYRTGDCGSWSRKGRLMFRGRLDGQLKIRGIRVEPAEIEAALEENPGVKRALVLAGETAPGHRGVLAYVESHSKASVTGRDLRRFLQGRLPGFLMPAQIFMVGSWPLTRHGKIDRSLLPQPQRPRPPEDVLASLIDELDAMTEEEARSLVDSGSSSED